MARVPGEEDEDREGDRQAARWGAGPRSLVRAGQGGDLEHALRAHDDLGQREPVVRERGEQLGVEPPGPFVARPALAGRDDLVDAIGRERRDEPFDVAPILGDGVAHPEPLDPPQFRRVEPAAEPRLDRVHGRMVPYITAIPLDSGGRPARGWDPEPGTQCSVVPVKVKASIRRAGTTTPPRNPLSVRRSRLTPVTAASASG